MGTGSQPLWELPAFQLPQDGNFLLQVSTSTFTGFFWQADGLGEGYAAACFEHTVVVSTKLETKFCVSVLPRFTKLCCSEVSCLPVLPSSQTTSRIVSPLPVGPFLSARPVGDRGLLPRCPTGWDPQPGSRAASGGQSEENVGISIQLFTQPHVSP